MKIKFNAIGSQDALKGTKAEVECEGTWTFKQLKETFVEGTSVPIDELRFVFGGKIAKDTDTLDALKCKDNCTIQVIRKSTGYVASASSTAPQAAAASSSATSVLRATAAAAPSPAGLPPGFPNIFGGAGSTPMFNPQMLTQMMQSPEVQNMVQEMLSNPQTIQQIFQNNPMLQSLQSQMPDVTRLLQNPEAVRSMASPEALQEATRLISQGGLPGAGGAGAPGNDIFTSMREMAGSPGFQEQMQNIMQSIGGGAGANPFANFGAAAPVAAGGDPAEIYAEQMKQLQDMGFLDKDANATALRETGGNVDAAIEKLLNSGFGN